MLFWHLGTTFLAVRYVFRDPAMDLRWVALGAILPDLIDKPIGSMLFNDFFGTHRLAAHAVIFPVLGMAVVISITQRGSGMRKGLIGLVIGVLFHLVLDGAWSDPEAFWWPLFGVTFPAVPDSAFWPLLQRMAGDPVVWMGEAAGIAYLLFVWRRHLSGPGEVGQALRRGRVPMTPRT